MRRATRIILDGVTVLSLVLAVTVAVLWAIGHQRDDSVWYATDAWSLLVENGGGQMRFELTRPAPPSSYISATGFGHDADKADGPIELGTRMPGAFERVRRFGFWFVTGERWGDYHDAAFLPTWFLEALFLALPVCNVICRAKAKPLRDTSCSVCGYNLYATPDRCPECGTNFTV